MYQKISIAILGLFVCIGTVHAQDAKWHAGVAKTAITPTTPTWMSGYAGRDKPAESKVHDLWAKALVLKAADGKKIVLVTLDLVGISRGVSVEVTEGIQKKLGVARADICLACSHTHCGPVVGNNLAAMYFLNEVQQKRVDDYRKELVGKIIDTAVAADATLSPASLSHGVGFVTFATNRRNNKEDQVPILRKKGLLVGPKDHDVPVLAVREPNGNVRAVVFGYACHATVLSFFQWCGDYPGFAQAALEEAYPGATALFMAGCGADQNPLPRRTVELAKRYGDELARGVISVLDAPMKALEPSIQTSYKEIDLALGDLPNREEIVKDLKNSNKYIAARAGLLLDELKKASSLRASYPYPVQSWRLGRDWTCIPLGGEVVVDYSLRLKKELGPAFVAGYCNDVMAYIPSLRVLKEGGYEGASSMIYYGLPTVWSPKVEESIVAEVHRQMAEMRRSK